MRLCAADVSETSVDEDRPAWCRLTGNELVSSARSGRKRTFLVCKGKLPAQEPGSAPAAASGGGAPEARGRAVVPVSIPAALPAPAPAVPVPSMAVMGIGSWPRPRWLLEALHARLEGRLGDEAFSATADDAVRRPAE